MKFNSHLNERKHYTAQNKFGIKILVEKWKKKFSVFLYIWNKTHQI